MLKKIITTGCLLLLISLNISAENITTGENTSVEPEFNVSDANSAMMPEPTIASLRRHVARQNERIAGLTTLVEGLSRSMFELKQQRGDSTGASSENASEVLQKLAQMIDEINSNYVSKSELKTILKSAGIKVAERSETPVEAEVKKSNKELYTEAVRYYAKRQYSAAKERFIQTSKAKYKPAASNYYLGEIAYYTKNYQDATVYFKKSIELYDKAGYIDVLLLHTAISLENMGDVEKAKTFYHNIIDNYKGYKSAKIAQKRLKKL